jgi:hypothetical protein
LYSISVNKTLHRKEIVCHAYCITETLLLASFFGIFGIIFRILRCQPQEIRYQLGEKIRMNIIIRSLGHAIETIKKDIPRKEAFQELMRRYGYL